MNNECIFGIIIQNNLNNMLKLLIVNKSTSNMSRSYLWMIWSKKMKNKNNDNIKNKNYFRICVDIHNEIKSQEYFQSKRTKGVPFYMENIYVKDIVSPLIKYKYFNDKINMIQNKIITLPKELCDITKIKHLYLEKNNLLSFPEEIYNMQHLTRIDLHNNNLVSIPCQVCSLSKLETLTLFDNNLTSLPKEMHQLKNIKNLEVQKNNLISLPSTMSEFNKSYVDISENNLIVFPKNIIKNVKEIKYGKSKIKKF